MIITETLEEVAKKYYNNYDKRKVEFAFIDGAKWQQKRSYSEEEVYNLTQQLKLKLKSGVLKWQEDFEFNLDKWFEQFKKK